MKDETLPTVTETLTRLRTAVKIAADGCEETWCVALREAFRAHAEAISRAQDAEKARYPLRVVEAEPPRFFIQDTRQYVGNAVLWWRVDGAGYTTNIDEAWQVPEDKARSIERGRSTDKAIPAEVALSVVSRVVNADPLHRALNAAKAQP